MHCHCGTNNRAPWWTFTDHCKPVVRPGAREESASPVWLAVQYWVQYWFITNLKRQTRYQHKKHLKYGNISKYWYTIVITHTSCVHITTVQEEELERVLHVRDVAVLGRPIGVNYPFRFIVAKWGRAYRKTEQFPADMSLMYRTPVNNFIRM